MGQNVLERMKQIGADKRIADFKVKQQMPYEFKKSYAYRRAWEFYEECGKRGLNCHVSVGGLDSKEKPCDDWAKEHNSVPYLGLMASEGGRRAKSLMINGCNYFGKSTIRSAPFAIFYRQDILKLALELDVPVPEIYGEIKKKPNGTLYTTKAQRTGCSMCGFGIHLEKRPHRFDRLRESNPREWEFWMYRCCIDPETCEKFGWGKVLDYIGVSWEDEYKEIEQMSIFEMEQTGTNYKREGGVENG